MNLFSNTVSMFFAHALDLNYVGVVQFTILGSSSHKSAGYFKLLVAKRRPK